MFSFIKEEPPFRWEGKTSGLDDWSEMRMGSVETEELPIKTQKTMSDLEKDENRSDWPFNWDWNGLFLHDFPLLELPNTVLLDTLKLVDNRDRMQLSFVCQKLRNMIVRNKTIDMDRRRVISCLFLELSDSIFCRSFMKCYDLPSFLEHVKRLCKIFHYQNVSLHFLETLYLPFDIDSIIEAFESKKEGQRVPVDYYEAFIEGSYGNSGLTGQMSDAFMKYPHLKLVLFDEYRPRRWNEYCTTVTEWAKANGKEVATESGFRYGFSKGVRNGKQFVDISDACDSDSDDE